MLRRTDIKSSILRFQRITAIIILRRDDFNCSDTNFFPGSRTEAFISTRYYSRRNVTVTRNCCVNLTHTPPSCTLCVSADRVLRSLAPTASSTNTQLWNCPRISSTGPLRAKGSSTRRLARVCADGRCGKVPLRPKCYPIYSSRVVTSEVLCQVQFCEVTRTLLTFQQDG